MNLASNIVELNNRAVGCLLVGNNDGSVSTLGKALADLQLYQDLENAARAHFQGAASQHIPTQGYVVDDLFANINVVNRSPICSIPLDSTNVETSESTLPGGTFTLFCEAFTISNNNGTNTLVHGTISGNYQRLMAVLLYNMGLSLHFQAVKNGRTVELRGAQDLYEMSFSIVESWWHEFDVEGLLLLLMALFNNLGHIHSTLFNMKQTQTCVDWLKALAGHASFQNLMARQQYAAFFMNLLVVLKQDRCCSPAA